mmetsp:Transcript_19404/g.55627  ORF Transcript_19404/g.55627 Transcript_19404/m.55627 type:complete len:90 (-) Transcript_19404:139-408(-)
MALLTPKMLLGLALLACLAMAALGDGNGTVATAAPTTTTSGGANGTTTTTSGAAEDLNGTGLVDGARQFTVGPLAALVALLLCFVDRQQ